MNLPSSSRKCLGLKLSGVSHSFLSKRTEVRLGITVVPCKERKRENRLMRRQEREKIICLPKRQETGKIILSLAHILDIIFYIMCEVFLSVSEHCWSVTLSFTNSEKQKGLKGKWNIFFKSGFGSFHYKNLLRWEV